MVQKLEVCRPIGNSHSDSLPLGIGLLGGVYKLRPINMLEQAFFLNLVILSAGTLYVSIVEKSVLPVINVSVGITLVITTFIIVHHCIRSLMKRYHVKGIYLTCILGRKRDNEDTDIYVQQCNFEAHSTVTYSVVEMKELLLHQ